MKKTTGCFSFLMALCLMLGSVHAEAPSDEIETGYPAPIDSTATIVDEAEDFPVIKSDYYYMVDMNTNQIMLDQDSYEKIYPASMTKMMTLLVAIENAPALDSTMTLGPEVFAGLAEAHASVAGFKQGESVTVEDLLYGLFLPSGADAAKALALKEVGSEEAFVGLMNQKAAALGMTDTHFVNTSGLHDADHYTTLRDLEKLMRYALENETFSQIFQTRRYTASPSLHPGGLTWESTLFEKLTSMSGDSPILGGKTGYTNPAGLCLASIAERNGTRYMLITAHAPVSNTPYHIIDAVSIYDYVYSHFAKQTAVTADQVLSESQVPFVLFGKELKLTSGKDIVLNLPVDLDLNTLSIEVKLNADVQAPIAKDEVLGSLIIRLSDEENAPVLYVQDLVSPKTYKRSWLLYTGHQIGSWIQSNLILSGLILLGLVMILILIRDWKWEQKRYKTMKKRKRRKPHR